eukprot:scpid58789/ scgid24547/ 
MGDRYGTSRHKVDVGTGYGHPSSSLRYDSAVSSAGQAGRYPNRLAGNHNMAANSSTDTLRNLSAQIQGMISETNTLRGSTDGVGGNHRGYSPAAAAAPYQTAPRPAQDTHMAHAHYPVAASAAVASRPTPISARSSQSLVDHGAYREPALTAENRPSSSLQVASLQEQVKLHKQTIDNLINDKTTLEQAVAKLELIVGEKEGDCSLAVQHIDQIKKQNEELVTSFGELERKHHQHTQVVAEKDQDISKLTAALQKVKQSCEALTREKEDLSGKLESQNASSVELQQAYNNLQERLAAAEAQAGEMASQRDSTSQYADLFKEKLTQQVSSLSEEIAALNQQLEEKDANTAQLQLQLVELQGSEAEKVTANEKRVQQLTSRLTEEKRSLQMNLDSEMEKNRNIHQQVIKQGDRINNLENQLTQTGSQASVSLRNVRQELEKERERLQEAGQEKDSLRRQLQDLHKEYSNLLTVHQQTKESFQSQGGDTRELESQLQEKTSQLRRVQEELLQTREGVDAVNRENTSLREHLQHAQAVASETAAATAAAAAAASQQGKYDQSVYLLGLSASMPMVVRLTQSVGHCIRCWFIPVVCSREFHRKRRKAKISYNLFTPSCSSF